MAAPHGCRHRKHGHHDDHGSGEPHHHHEHHHHDGDDAEDEGPFWKGLALGLGTALVLLLIRSGRRGED